MLDVARPQSPLEALQQFFGYESFRLGQEEIIRTALAGVDTLVVMPTGGGKSLCYQIPALILDGVSIVVSPLIALMKDQVDALERRGVRATTINSGLDFSEVRQRMTDIKYGAYSLVYVAPERFDSQGFLELLKGVRIALFAIDEAHCISEWGHDFRPSYLKLRTAIETLGHPTVIALTATATPYVQQDIITQLDLHDPKRFVRGFDRPNLRYNVRESNDKDADLREIIKRDIKRDGATIVYCGTRRAVESVGTMLHAEELPVAIYHAGIPDEYRRASQDAFISGRARIIVATNAFGMGIDKADVRHVIHFEMPGSIEAYYQEAGRAGRDNKPSDCTLLYSARDRRLQEFFIRSTYPDRVEIEAVYNGLWDAIHVGLGSRYEGVFVPDEKDIIARSKIHGSAFQSTLGVLEKNGVIRKVRADRLGMVRILATSRDIQDYYTRTRDEDRKQTIVALLRTLGGAALSQETFVNPAEISARHGLTVERFERSMRALMLAGLVRYTPPTPGTGYQFIGERLPSRSVVIDEKAIETGRSRALLKLDAVERYIRSTTCRRDYILDYFCAEHELTPCGRCDVCTGGGAVAKMEKRPHTRRAAEQLLAAVAELGGRFGKMTLVDLLRGTRTQTITQFGLESYPRFGELRDMERTELSRLADEMVDDRLLERTATLKPLVRITPLGQRAIAHLTLIRFVPPGREPEGSDHPEILKRLRAERETIARRDGLAPVSVCPDHLLVRISNDLPTSRRGFLAVEGMTDQIYQTCGSQLIMLIESMLNEQEWSEDAPAGLPDRLRRTFMLLADGCSIEEIARRSALESSTVSGHVEELIGLGLAIDIERLVPAGLLKSVRTELDRAPRASLREIRSMLGGSIGYPELRVAVAWIKKGGGNESQIRWAEG